ncbi:MAG: PadR family transcriptional regulator [Hyphomonadaceae bacterium]|nr:PadR family transcriptional regulator [Hyphomonadaceae bacterium]
MHAGFGHRGWHGGGRGRGFGRFFAHGDLRLVILHLIGEKPRHGYDIIKAVEEMAGGAYSPSPGVIYPTLTLLEDLNYVAVSASSEGAKKLFEITDQGRAFLDANRPSLDALLARMGEVAGARQDRPQILRAMQNLKVALRLKLSSGALTDAQLDAISEMLDETARKIEKA